MTCKNCEKEFDEYKTKERFFSNGTKHLEGLCPFCGSHQRFLSQGGEDILYFGKFKGEKISDIVKKDRQYLEWLRDNFPKMKRKIDKYLC